jgi:hypothetical protein
MKDMERHGEHEPHARHHPNDAEGRANLRIFKGQTNSSNADGNPANYTQYQFTMDPDDGDIVWNAAFSRWEVGFLAEVMYWYTVCFVRAEATVLPVRLVQATAACGQITAFSAAMATVKLKC